MPLDPASLAAHDRVGRYEIIARVAAGGMATVYLARARGALGFEREVALKLTHPHLRDASELTAVLLEEGKLAARIRHSNVVSVLDVGEDPRGIFLVMEYVEGDSLAGLIRKGARSDRPMPVGMSMRILVDALAGLHASHELRGEDGESLGLVHRDFSPHNILVGTDGVAKLSDFGIAKATSRLGHTATGVVKGKAAYMAPEQARGQPVDRRCDVWAAGIIAWEMLSGLRMHGDVEGLATLVKVISEAPPRLRDIKPDIAPQLDDAVASALTMDVLERCPSAAVLARRLEDAFTAVDRLATREQVAAYVNDVVGEQLAQRRARASATLREIEATTVALDVAADTTEPMTTLTRARRVQTGVTDEAGPREATRTETTSTADTGTPSVAASPRGRRLAIVAVGATALVALAAGSASLFGRATSPATSGSAAAVVAPAPTPSATPSLSSAVPTASSALDLPASGLPRAPHPAMHHPRRTLSPATPPPAPSPAAAPGAPLPLAPSPYSH